MAVHYPPRPCIRSSQQLRSPLHIAGFQRPANLRAAHMFSLQLLRQHHLDAHFSSITLILCKPLNRVFLLYGALRFRRRVNRLPSPKPMVIPDDQHLHAQLLLQHLLHELPGCQRRHRFVEGQDIDVIDACGLEQRHLLLGCRQQRRHSTRREHRPRVAVEGDDERPHTTLQCLILHLPDEALMAAMHAIEEADGSNHYITPDA